MIKKLIKSFSVFSIILMALNTNVKAESIETKRLWGTDRYATCSEIVNEGWKSSEYVVIVNGLNFPDALSASTLAKKYSAPILLTETEKLDDNTYSQIKRLKVKKAFIVGGTGVISSKVENQLHKLDINTERFSGIDRTETSVAVAEQIGTSNGIILTTDSSYTDALSAAPIAAKLQIPIILIPKDSIPSSVSNFVKEKNIPKTYVLGGQDLISENVASKFNNVQRISGNDKYERNINIIDAFSDKFDFSSVCLAYAKDFADALSGSAFAALQGNPIVLVGDNSTAITKKFAASRSFNKLYVLGGTAGIKEDTVCSLTNNKVITKNVQADNKKLIENKKDDTKVLPETKSDDKKPMVNVDPADNMSTNNSGKSEVDTALNSSDMGPHSDLQKNLYSYFMNLDNRKSVNERAIELHGGVKSNNCVYFASEGLRRAGLTDLPESICNTKQLTAQLNQRGWTQCTDLSKLRPGDICFTTNGPSHAYTFMQWVKDNSYDYAYICDNQGNEFAGDPYHQRNVQFATPEKEATAYFMYIP